MQHGIFDLFDFGNPPCDFPWCKEVSNNKLYVRCSAGHAIDEDCFRNYLRHVLDEKKTNLVFCPIDFCSGIISSIDLELVAQAEQIKNLTRINVCSAFTKEQRVECACGAIFWMDESCLPLPKAQILECASCNRNFCSRCQFLYDKDLGLSSCNRCTGEIAKARKQIESAILTAHSAKCPQCKHPWIKNLDCTHMRCGRCNTEYCYVCNKTLAQLQQEDPTIERLFDHNQGYPSKGTCPMYIELLRELYAPDVEVRRTKRKAALRAEEAIRGRPSRRRPESSLDIVPPLDPELALEWFHVQKATDALNVVKQNLGRRRWTLVQETWPDLLGSVEWAAPLIPWTV